VKKRSGAGRRRATRTPARAAARRPRRSSAVAAAPVTAAELRALRDEIDRRMRPAIATPRSGRGRPAPAGAPLRWNPEKEDVQRSVAQLVLTIVEFLRRLMERQAIRRMEQKTLTRKEVEAVGEALMKLEDTVREIGAKFGLTPEDLNLDLGPIGKLM
jgi:gas vesicle protein GvpK